MAKQQQLTVPRRRARNVRPEHPVNELDIWLMQSDPPIWRSVAVAAQGKLADLHEVIQIAFGWENCHMHQFVTKAGRRYALPPDSDDPFVQDLHDLDETTTRIRDVFEQLKERLAYEYDFGDSWVHGVKLVATHEDGGAFPTLPLCLGGERAAPPEDCGGLWGFYEKLEIVHKSDPDDEWHQDVLEWMGDYEPEKLDIESVNRDLKQYCP